MIKVVMQQSMQAAQQHASGLAPKVSQLTQDTMAALKRAEDRAATSAAQPSPSPQAPQQQPQ